MADTVLQVSWPLSIVVDDQVLGKYNQILIFLMQVTCCWLALCCPLRTRPAAEHQLCPSLHHSVVLSSLPYNWT